MSKQMYIMSEGGVLGPFTREEIADMGKKGVITPTTSVSLDQVQWFEASVIRSLEFGQSQQGTAGAGNQRPSVFEEKSGNERVKGAHPGAK